MTDDLREVTYDSAAEAEVIRGEARAPDVSIAARCSRTSPWRARTPMVTVMGVESRGAGRHTRPPVPTAR